MEENNIENKEINMQNSPNNNPDNNSRQIAGAIVIAGLIIAGAILIKGGKSSESVNAPTGGNGIPVTTTTLASIGKEDRTLGSPQAKVTIVMYEDFQCPFCGAINGLEPNSPLIQSLKQRDPTWTPFMPGVKDYITNGTVRFVYRDWAFLGPESIQSAEAARCAGDQGKFWEYHDYLYSHQNGENQGSFSDPHLKTFAKTLGLNSTIFDQCLDSGKYAQAVADSKTEGTTAGVTGTPKGFILKNGKIVGTIEGAEPFSAVKQKIDSALK